MVTNHFDKQQNPDYRNRMKDLQLTWLLQMAIFGVAIFGVHH